MSLPSQIGPEVSHIFQDEEISLLLLPKLPPSGRGSQGSGRKLLARTSISCLKACCPRLDPNLAKKWRKLPARACKGNRRRKTTWTPAHGDREMPIWGPIFHEVESDQDWGEVRVDAITKYLESIQQK